MPARMLSFEGGMGLRSWRYADGTANLRAVVAANTSTADGVASALKPRRTRISPYPAAATARVTRISETTFQIFMSASPCPEPAFDGLPSVSGAKYGSSERSARESAIHNQFDRVDVRRIVRGKEKHSLGQIFCLAPTAKRNRGREEVGKFCGFLLSRTGARPALPDGSLRRSRGHHVHANLARCKIGGDGSRHRYESAFRGSVGSHAWLTEIALHRSVEDDARVVVQQRSGGVDGEESAIQVGVDDVLKHCFVRRAGRRAAANSGIGEDDVELAEFFVNICEEPLAVVRHGNVGAIAARVGS